MVNYLNDAIQWIQLAISFHMVTRLIYKPKHHDALASDLRICNMTMVVIAGLDLNRDGQNYVDDTDSDRTCKWAINGDPHNNSYTV